MPNCASIYLHNKGSLVLAGMGKKSRRPVMPGGRFYLKEDETMAKAKKLKQEINARKAKISKQEAKVKKLKKKLKAKK